jgi:hypothetical protein
VFQTLAGNLHSSLFCGWQYLWYGGFVNGKQIQTLARSGRRSLIDVRVGSVEDTFWPALVHVFYPGATQVDQDTVDGLSIAVRDQLRIEWGFEWGDTYNCSRVVAWKVGEQYLWLVHHGIATRVCAFGYCEDPEKVRQQQRDVAVVLSLRDRLGEPGLLKMIAELSTRD